MNSFPSTKAKRVLAALIRTGWIIKRQNGSHRIMSKSGLPDYVFAFHDNEDIGPKMLARVSKNTGLRIEDL